MITARQLKNGFVVEMQKELFTVLHSQHIKPGKGGAFVRAKLKSLRSGSIVERTYRPEDTFEQAYIEQKKMHYLYRDQSTFHFMDETTFEQVGISKDTLGSHIEFLKDGMDVTASIHKHTIVEIVLPPFVELKVTYTEPGIRGDTQKGGTKPATLETGAVVKVPLFIDNGDTIRIDTRTGEYSGRV